MAFEVTMPQMGADMTEGTVIKWLKEVGDEIERGEIIAEIETDKANVDLEAFQSGTLIKVAIPEGETVAVGEVIALLGDPDEKVEDEEKPERAEKAEGEEEPEAEPKRKPRAETPRRRDPETAAVAEKRRELKRGDLEAMEDEEGKRVRISPVARRIAVENDFDYRALKGSGPGGRILRRDVEEAIGKAEPAAEEAEKPAAEEEERAAAAPPRERREEEAPVEGLSRIRQTIARRMSQSKQQQPHYYLTLDVDMTDALEFRRQVNDGLDDDRKVSINDLVVKACALAIDRHPKFNASYSEEGLVRREEIAIDIGVALEDGLIAVTIRDCDRKSLGQIAIDAKDVIQRAREGHLRADQYGNGTFTITNLGAYGVETLIGIINPPQAAILGVGSVMPQAVARDGEVVVRDVMKVALSADHRVTDGAEGAVFIKEIQQILENPYSLAL